MNISGVMVQTLPENREKVAKRLAQLEGVEIHASEDNKIVATIEDVSSNDEVTAIGDLLEMPGIIAANMIYHYFEEETDTKVNKMKPNYIPEAIQLGEIEELQI
jgi:nitrate reductase NapD